MKLESIPYEIAYCTSFDVNYEPEQLIDLETIDSLQNSDFVTLDKNRRGWQTKKHPEYPQDLILQLKNGLCRISKIEILSHHYKIASQIELYAGITKEKEQDSLYIQFSRLGFVNFDSNNRFQDRELKSIKIQADCEYIRLVIKGCYDNRLNVDKQVGFLAINILGYSAQPPQILSDSPSRSSSIYNTNELDFNLENWIRVIQNAEEESAQDEDYKEAKIYKELGDRLTGLWRFLMNLENEKQEAVASKDYDEADKIKADMVQVKETAENLLKQSGIQISNDGDILPYDNIPDDEDDESVGQGIMDDENESKLSNIAAIQQQQQSKPSDQLLEEAIANWTSFDALSIHSGSSSLLSERVIPIQPASDQGSVQDKVEEIIEDPETIPEPLTLEDREYCELPISLFGENMISCIMSVKVKCRQNGLYQLSQLIELESFKDTADLKFIQATIVMLQEAIMDSRESIFNQTVDSWKDLQDIFPKLKKNDDKKLHGWIEKFFSRLLSRTNDSNPGIKSNATTLCLELIESYHDFLLTLCFKERMIRNVKDAKARIDLITLITRKFLVVQWKTGNTSLYRPGLMTFIVSYLKKHPHADIQKLTWDLLVLVAKYQQKDADFKAISTYLDNDSIKKLQQELKKKLKSSTSTTVQELRALAVKSNKSAVKKPISTVKQTKTVDTKKKAVKSQPTKEKKKTETPAVEEEKTNVCIFCDEVNDDFNEDTLISHYYNYCPVLTNCPMCKIILEVSTLNEHLQLDCEKKHLVKQCNNCKQSIPVEQWLQHTLKKTCLVTLDNQSRCPFCHLDMTNSTEANWKTHLIHKCAKNPRLK